MDQAQIDDLKSRAIKNLRAKGKAEEADKLEQVRAEPNDVWEETMVVLTWRSATERETRLGTSAYEDKTQWRIHKIKVSPDSTWQEVLEAFAEALAGYEYRSNRRWTQAIVKDMEAPK